MLRALNCHLSQKRLGCDQEEDACNRGKGSLLTLQGTSEQKIVIRRFCIRSRMRHEARHSRAIGSVTITAHLQQVGFFGTYNRCVLDEETDEENGNHPVHIGNDADTEAKNEIPEVQRIADMCIGTCRHKISRGAQCPSPRRTTSISHCPNAKPLAKNNQQTAEDNR